MDKKIITYVLTLLTVAELRSPQVHEEVNETPNNEPTNNQRFNFEVISQADRQKWRYMQQQAVDAWHQERNAGKNRRPKAPRKRNVNNLEQVEILTKDINHGLGYFDNSQSLEESANAQLKMLNSLIGQDPALQLEGLQKLLNAKDHTPITEDVIDVANPSNRPNVKVESGPPEFQKVVANVLVLQADAQRQIKEHNQLNLAEYERQLQAAQPQQLSNEQQLQHVILEEEHSTYGPVTNSLKRPQKSIYGDDQVSILQRHKRESDCEEEDWYLDYDFDNFTSDNNTSSLSDNQEYFYEIYNETDYNDFEDTVDEGEGGENRRHYKIVNVPAIVKDTEHDSKPLNYIVINNSNGGSKGHETKHNHRRIPQRKRKKRKFKKRPPVLKPRGKNRKKQKSNKLKFILSKLDHLHF